MPAVMACCDPETATHEQLLESCASDVLEQVCRSIPARLEKLLEDKVIKVERDQARVLTRWLNEHQQAALDNFTIRFEGASITHATVPDDASEHLSCEGIDFNNDQVFESEVEVSPGINQVRTLIEVDGDANVASRTGAGPVTGSARLTTRSSCVTPRCSSLSVTTGPSGELTLEELEIYGAGPAVLTDGEARVGVERGVRRSVVNSTD